MLRTPVAGGGVLPLSSGADRPAPRGSAPGPVRACGTGESLGQPGLWGLNAALLSRPPGTLPSVLLAPTGPFCSCTREKEVAGVLQAGADKPTVVTNFQARAGLALGTGRVPSQRK